MNQGTSHLDLRTTPPKDGRSPQHEHVSDSSRAVFGGARHETPPNFHPKLQEIPPFRRKLRRPSTSEAQGLGVPEAVAREEQQQPAEGLVPSTLRPEPAPSGQLRLAAWSVGQLAGQLAGSVSWLGGNGRQEGRYIYGPFLASAA